MSCYGCATVEWAAFEDKEAREVYYNHLNGYGKYKAVADAARYLLEKGLTRAMSEEIGSLLKHDELPPQSSETDGNRQKEIDKSNHTSGSKCSESDDPDPAKTDL